MSQSNTLKVSISGVRGIVGEALTPRHISDFAAAFGAQMGKGRIVVGRDTRPTGQMLEHAVISGLLSVGCKPTLVGISPTPTVQIAVKNLQANGGIVISASHNPEQWNALKFIGAGGLFLNSLEAEELLNAYNQPYRNYVSEHEFRSPIHFDNIFSTHQKLILDSIDTNKIQSKKFKVLIDCCNGVGALTSRSFLEALGCEVTTLFEESDGQFRRRPEPIPENLQKISAVIKSGDFDIGFAQDPDGDRIVVINNDGTAIGEQFSLILAAEHILSKNHGSTVVANVQTSMALEDVAKKYDSKVVYSPVGEINVTEVINRENAIIGGEGGSGGVIWPKVHPCRDSYTGIALILELLAEREQSLTDILNEIPSYISKSLKYPINKSDAIELIRELNFKFEHLEKNQCDGLRVSWEDGWALIRPSNTEPAMRVFIEALTPEALDRIEDEIGVIHS